MKDIISFIKSNKIFITLLLCLTFLSYANVLRGEFVTADDFPGILNNPLVRDLSGSLETLRGVNIKNALIYYFFGMRPGVFHLVGVLIHLLNVFLVFIFIGQLFDNVRVSKIATTIFALHPVNTEAIMWISGNPYAMVTSFGLFVFIFYLLFENNKKPLYLFLSILSFIILIILDRGAWPLVIPIVLLIMNQFIVTKRFDIKKSLIIVPFILLAGISAYNVLTTNYDSRVQELTSRYYFDPKDAPPMLNRFPFSIYMSIKYFIFPYELNIYPGEKVLNNTEINLVYITTFIFIVTFIYLLIKKRLYAGLILSIIASIAPVFSPVQVAWIMTERYLYLGSIFFAILVSLIFLNNKKFAKKYLDTTLLFIVILFIIRILFRSEDWTTNKKLWYSTLKFSPDSYRVYNNLGDVYIKENNFEKAKESFEMSFKVFPLYADAMHNLGMVYLLENDFDTAEKYMQMAIDTNPNLAAAYEKMGLIYYNKGDIPQAYEFSTKALSLNPNLPYAKNILNSIDNQSP